MVTFFIEQDVPEVGVVQKFMYAAQEIGHRVILTDKATVEPIKDIKGPVVFFGCLNSIKSLQKEPNKPIIWCDWDLLSCHSYYSHYGKYLFQQEYGFYPFGEIPRLKEFLYQTYGVRNSIFIRPDANDKVFTGEVVGEPQFEYWLSLAKFYEPKPDTLCVVSKPVKIHSEYRFIVMDGKVVTGSQYKIGGMIQSYDAYNQAMVAYVEEMASIWQPHPIFVMDIAITSEFNEEKDDYLDKMHLLEIGMVNGAGFYNCDIRSIVRAMADVAERN